MGEKINLELKYFCKDFNLVRNTLRLIGAKKIGIERQKDYFFNLPKEKNKKVPARLKLRISGRRQVLIFYKRPNFSIKKATQASILVLPVKGKKILSLLSKALGVKVIVEKQREIWEKGNTVFHLDKVKGIGKIFEMEVRTKPKTLERDKHNFEKYKEVLLPYLDKVIRESNEDLVLKAKKHLKFT